LRRRRTALTLAAIALIATACNAVIGNELGHLEAKEDASPDGSPMIADAAMVDAPKDVGAPDDGAADADTDAGPWSPLAFGTSLGIWLDADRGISTTICGGVRCAVIWADQSGNGNDARPPMVSAAPIIHANAYNGHSALTFDGATTSLAIDDSISSEITGGFAIIAVAATAASTKHQLGDIYSKTGNPLPFAGPGLFVNYSMAGVDGSDGRIGSQVDFYQYIVSAEAHLDDGALRVYTSTFDGTKNLSMRVNDGPPSTIATMGVASGSLRASGIASSVGGRLGTQQLFLGDIAELLLVTRATTPAEATQAYAFLKAKYGIP